MQRGVDIEAHRVTPTHDVLIGLEPGEPELLGAAGMDLFERWVLFRGWIVDDVGHEASFHAAL